MMMVLHGAPSLHVPREVSLARPRGLPGRGGIFCGSPREKKKQKMMTEREECDESIPG